MTQVLLHTAIAEAMFGFKEWKCGDKCIGLPSFDSGGETCECVDTFQERRTFGWDDGLWCCNSEPCLFASEGASCNGTTLPLTQPCRGECNYNSTLPNHVTRVSARSYMPDMCSEECVREMEVCQGAGRCDEERRWCRNEHSTVVPRSR